MTAEITIAGRSIGAEHPTFIIAELSANHNQSYDRALELVHAAKEAGADAIKLQTYTADTLTIPSNRPEFLIKGGEWDGRRFYDLYQEAHTPWQWQPKLCQAANSLGLPFFSTPFDATAVDFLEDMGVPAHKIASFELVDLPLIRRVAATGKPMIMSTGMATLAEINDAVEAARDAGATELALLKCTSSYPAPPEQANLRTIPHLAEAFGVVAGLSDHTLGIAVPVAAATLGAKVIEKHFTLRRSDGGPDSSFSLQPDEFRTMVDAVRVAESAVGGVSYQATDAEVKSRLYRRSLYVVKPIAKGEPFTDENVRSIRPALGLPPKHLPEVLGTTAAVEVPEGVPLEWKHLAAWRENCFVRS